MTAPMMCLCLWSREGPEFGPWSLWGHRYFSLSSAPGVTYPDNHPEAAEQGMRRGEYGAGHGKQPSWGYYGEPGTNGVVHTKKDGKEVVITQGNPANMSMYETVKHLEGILPGLAKEVFR